MDGLDKYLQKKHLDYCLEVGEVLTESEWVKVLNKKLPSNDKLAYPSVNQWMNGDRTPDANNIIRLIKVFGSEVMPYIGIDLPADLARLVRDWDQLDESTKDQIIEIAKDNKSSQGELATAIA